MNLQIQCPQCSKRFMVHQDLSGKTVECGACDYRFRVAEETIIVEKERFYPGEHRNDDFLSRIGKSPSASVAAKNPAISPIVSHRVPDVTAIMPASPSQNIAVVSGLIILVLYGLIFFLGTEPDQLFKDVTLDRRLILGAFVSFVAGGLVIFGAKNWRIQAVVLTLVMVSTLAALILIRPLQITPATDAVPTTMSDDQAASTSLSSKIVEGDELKSLVGYATVERRLEQLRVTFGEDAEKHLISIFIKNLSSNDFNEIEKFLRDSLAYPNEKVIQRFRRNNERDSLIILSEIKLDLDHLMSLCEKLGRAVSHPELRLIEVHLSAARFAPSPADLREKLIDPSRASFFAANLDELFSINSSRVKEAIRRLATISPEIERRHEDSIIAQFLEILERETEFETLSFLGQALILWAPGNEAAGEVVSAKIAKLLKNSTPVSPPLAEFLLVNQRPEALPVIDQLWSDDPVRWSELYQKLGPLAEDELLRHLQKSRKPLQYAAASMLASVGGPKSLSVLEKYRASSDTELKILVHRAIEMIEKRQ